MRISAAQSFTVTFVAVVILAAFLSPLLRSFTVSIKSPEQNSQVGGPLLPSSPATFNYRGRDFSVYEVPFPDGTTRELALVRKGRTSSQFVDPKDASRVDGAELEHHVSAFRVAHVAQAGLLNLEDLTVRGGHWGGGVAFGGGGILNRGTLVITHCAVTDNFSSTGSSSGGGGIASLGRLFIAGSTVANNTAVQSQGGGIFSPSAVTIIPEYFIFTKIGWVGTWLPLLVPTFFANAYDVFLLRQYLLTIPREMDEAAAIDGAGPMRTLVSVLVPQAWPVIIAVAIFHLVYSWNDFFAPLIYLSTNPDLVTLPVGLASFSGARIAVNPGLIQAGTLMTMVIPVVLFLVFQRFFVRGVVITGVER